MRSTAMPAAATTALRLAPATTMRRSSAAASRPSSVRLTVCTWSWRRSAMTQPSAEVMPGKRGTSAHLSPTSRISAPACSAPPPPNGMAAKLRRIVPALDRDQPDRAGHARVGDPHDRLRRLHRRRARAARRHASAMARLRRLDVERVELAADRPLGIDAAEHDLGVGQRRPRVALAVAGRPRHRAGALRPDLQQAAAIDRRRSSRRRRRWS